MELLDTVVNAAVVALVGLVLSLQLRGEGKARRREMDQLREDIRDIRAELRDLRVEMGSSRADITRVALAVGAGPATGTEHR